MPHLTMPSVPKKAAYKRPYKSRQQRREVNLRKHDEAKDYKFLWRAVSVVGLLLVVALACALKGMSERDQALERTTSAALR